MWASILEKFECCLNPGKDNGNKSQANKEVSLDKLEEKVKYYFFQKLKF